MSELDLRLEWQEAGPAPEVKTGDRFEASQVEEAEAAVTEVEPAVIEPPRRDTFEYSEHRARALEKALGRLLGVERPPFVQQLKEVMAGGDPQALDGLEAWLSTQLADWNSVGPVEADPEYPDEEELATLFNEAVSKGGDALGLALELITLLRNGERSLAGRLLENVEELMRESREILQDLYQG